VTCADYVNISRLGDEILAPRVLRRVTQPRKEAENIVNITSVSSLNWDIDFSQHSHKRRPASSDDDFAAKVLAGSSVGDAVTLSPSSGGAPLNFKSMTRSELISAAQQLRSEGKLSGDQAAVLEGFACAYAAAPGPPSGVSTFLTGADE
jgi:hypothetical protein